MTTSIASGVLQMNQEAWIWTGVLLGAAAGMLGAYVGCMRASRPEADSPQAWVACATLGLALGLGAVVTRIRLDAAHRLVLLLPVLLLGYWFIRQVGSIRRARGKESAENQERCHQK